MSIYSYGYVSVRAPHSVRRLFYNVSLLQPHFGRVKTPQNRKGTSDKREEEER